MTVLYRKYRPQKLSEIIGQEHITHSLLKQLESGKIQHAYLFTGPKGTGKTSTARIIAKAVNCQDPSKTGEPCNKCENCEAISRGNYLDLIEMDAASNRGIDDVRELREKIKLAPSAGRYKVYIIDEAHMLTPEAFSALLKTLEEPPSHAIFILATTEPQKLPGTIISRSQRFDFGRPDISKIQEKLKNIMKSEGWKIDDSGLAELAKAADGAFRDAEVLLEKVATVNPSASREEVLQLIGKKNLSQVLEILEIVEKKETKGALLWLDEFVSSGGNVRVLNEAIIEILRKILLIKSGVGEKLVRDVNPETYQGLSQQAEKIDQQRLDSLIKLFIKSIEDISMATIPQLPLELALIVACDYQTESEVEVGESAEAEKPVVKKVKKETDIQRATEAKDRPEVRGEPKSEVSEEKLLKKVKAAWPKILRQVKAKNKSLEIFLRGAVPDRVEEDVVYLKFYYRFHKERVEDPRNRKIIEEILEKEVDSPVRIKGIMGEKPSGKTKQEKELEEVKGEEDPAGIFGKLD